MNSNIFIDNLKKVRSGKYDKIMPIYLHLNMFDNDEKMGLPKYKYSQTCQKIHGMHTHNTLENYCRRGIFLKRPLILFNIEFFLRERERGRERFSIFFLSSTCSMILGYRWSHQLLTLHSPGSHWKCFIHIQVGIHIYNTYRLKNIILIISLCYLN